MKRFTNQSNGSQAGRMYNGGAKFCRFALFPLMLLILLLLPAGMVAQTEASSSKYIATYESSTQTLTFKENVGETLPGNSAWVKDKQTVADIKRKLGNVTIVHIVFDKSFSTYAPTSLYKFFANLTKLKTITGLEYLNTEKVTNMSYMFFKCSSLTSLDVTHFNTAKVTNMNSMFDSCSSLTSLDVTYFNTANVTGMNNMFYSCSALTTIYASDNFVTDKVEYSYNMFYDCTSLKGTTLEYVASKTDHNYANCGTDGYFTPGCGYAEFDNATGTLTFSYKVVKPEGAYDLNVGITEPGWRTHKNEIKKVVFDTSFANARPTSCYYWFYECKNLANIEGIENLNTEKVTNMELMFANCSTLTSLDVTKFNTANVTTLMSMFSNCSSLKSLDVTNFDTRNVTNMFYMFNNCSGLTSLDLTKFNTAEVTDMRQMFHECSALTTIYASDEFVTTNVETGSNMFFNCIKLKGFIEYNKNTDKENYKYANYKTGYFTKLVGKNGDEKIGATGETLATDNLVLDDNKDFVAYEPFAAKAASYNRTMKEGTTWATLCLPFEVSLENQNFRAFKLLSADDVTETVELEEIETSIAAGTPVIIKMKDGATKLDFTVANMEIANEVKTAETANGNYQLQGLYTQKLFSKDADNNCYIVKGDKLMNPAKLLGTSTEFVGSKPFRAYMVDNSSAPAAGARMFSISVGGSTTVIEQLETTADSKAEYYDLQGRRLQDLQKGINIVKRGGKTMKVIIK